MDRVRMRDGVRKFDIRFSDPRSMSRFPRMPGPSADNDHSKIREIVGSLTQSAYEAGSSSGTKKVADSHISYWREFCEVMNVDGDLFGKLPTGALRPSVDQVNDELRLFGAFATYVVYFPRRKHTKDHTNSVDYAEQMISSIRTHYALKMGRRPGLVEGSNGGAHLRRVLNGLRKLRPTRKRVRLPILQHHLRAIKETLNLKEDQTHRTLWALWLTAWQGVMRSSDLIRRQGEERRSWSCSNDTHRGRVSVDIGRSADGHPVGARISLLIKPNKTDQAGEQTTVKTFIVDTDPAALSAGEAIRQMLKYDRSNLPAEDVPLFRNPLTGGEITYEESRKALNGALRQAGFVQMANGTHSLRIGGATAYANTPTGGELFAGFMGLWKSNSKLEYMHACAPRIEAVGIAIAREGGMQISRRPGAVSKYAMPPRR